jgi:hypothetical protein
LFRWQLNYADVKKSLAADTKPTEVLKAAALKFKNASAAEKQVCIIQSAAFLSSRI